MTRYLIGLAVWLACVSIGGFAMGQQKKASVSVSGEVATNPICCAIADLIRTSARRYGVEEMRALKLAWAESRHTDAVRIERNGSRSCGPLQVHEKFTPGICEATLVRKIDEGLEYFARLIRKYGDAAERVYIHGHR